MMNICTKKKLYHQIDFFHRVFGQKMCGKSWRITWVVPRRNYSNFRSNDVLFLEKWRVVFRKMTCCFRKNDVSFLEKWRVVFGKVTCCFWKSDVLFLEKWRVVFEKVTCCFWESDVSFSEKWRVVFRKVTCRFWESVGKVGKEKRGKWIVKIPVIVCSRACVRAHALQEFSLFCCHKCHGLLVSC